jgi:hypothetical protein
VPIEFVDVKVVKPSSAMVRRAARTARPEPDVYRVWTLDANRTAVFARPSSSLAWFVGAAAVAAGLALAAVAVLAPWGVTFAVAVLAAVAWSAWLDRCPEV